MADSLNDVIARVKNEYNICEVVEEENVLLKRTGAGTFSGLCPFHNEKTPSFTVSERFQNYKCFGCGESGDVFEFIKKTKMCSFMDALKYLAERRGIELPKNSAFDEDGPRVDMNQLYKISEEMSRFYRLQFLALDDSHPAKRQILDRGLSLDNEVYGYAPEDRGIVFKHLTSLGFEKKSILDTNLFKENSSGQVYSIFVGRLTFTLTDFTGRPVSFTYRRVFDSDNKIGKYVNGKTNKIFEKRGVLYNLDLARKPSSLEKNIYLTEGQFDVEALKAIGIANVVASSGTAFTESHVRLAKQVVGDKGKLTFAFDGDSAGIKAAYSVFNNYPLIHTFSEVVLFPEGKDPCDIYKEDPTGETLREILKGAKPIVDFVVESTLSPLDLTDVNERINGVRDVISSYVVNAESNELATYMIRKMAVTTGIPVGELNEILNEARSKVKKPRGATQPAAPVSTPDAKGSGSSALYNTILLMGTAYPEDYLRVTSLSHLPSGLQSYFKEVASKLKEYEREGKPYRLIVEDYSEENIKLARRAYQLIEMGLTSSYLPSESNLAYYKGIQKKAFNLRRDEVIERERENAFTAISLAKSSEEALSLYEGWVERKTAILKKFEIHLS